jgi:hypothetical protein
MRWLCAVLFACTLSAVAVAQDSTAGTVVSSNSETLVVKTTSNQYRLFLVNPNTVKPQALTSGDHVRVDWTEREAGGTPMANTITLEAPASQATATQAAAVPQKVQNVETQVKHQVRRWRLGGRVGVGLDPELLMFGVHSQIGPIFNRNVLFRPNAEFDWGEVTDMIAVNLEAIYRLPAVAARGQTRRLYVGAGPALNFIHQSFQQGRSINFGNFTYSTGFNILGGLMLHRGTFVELKTSLYSRPAPVLHLIFGKNW